MATELRMPSARTGSVTTDQDPTAPAAPAGPGLGRFLRGQIGVHEPILDRAPAERAIYSRYGAIVLATALIGGVSVCFALTALLDRPSVWALLSAGATWSLFVYLIDSWLVSGTHGKVTGRRRLALLPRFLLSLLLGLAIAEPLLFTVFAPEIDKYLAGDREQAVQVYYRNLLRCNPTDGSSTEARPDCADFQLGLPGSPAALGRQITDVKEQLATLNTHIGEVDRQQNKLDTTSDNLCSRKNYIFVKGVRDITQQCRIARADADSYRKGNNVGQERRKATALRNQVGRLTSSMKAATDEYHDKVVAAARTKRAAKEAELRSTGLLDRAEALWAVMTSAFYPFFFAILLHLLLLVMDSLPVLAKLMGGVTRYDRLLHHHMESVERRYETQLRSVEDRHRRRLEHGLAIPRIAETEAREAAEHRLAQARARRESERRALIDQLSKDLLSDQ
ncbi:DUF4407 domain-containing protein [Streptomyces sp. NPDC101234]|uniref:DUF4407 domain-containing protein n=1 Tax=Streptomyces sp. NPDC101234 TaxID=3366138 RepID=UPI0037F70329